MPSEKELFITKQYVPTGEPIVSNNHVLIYHVKCMAEPGKPDGILKMYRKKNVTKLYSRLMALDYSEWPHIYNVKYFDESTLVVEELLKGNTLKELLERNRQENVKFSEEEASHIMDEICYAIEQLQNAAPPIVHHNLKPSNIFVTRSGNIRFLDFESDTYQPKGPHRSLWNILGSMFHEMLTGRAPSGGKSSYEGRFRNVIQKCMEKNPEKSYETVQQMQEDIEHARTHEPEPAGPAKTRRGIPYTLTFPFQGTILGFEWLLFSYFLLGNKDNTSTSSFFLLIFCVHAALFGLRRYSYMKKEKIFLGPLRTAYPIVVLAAALGLLTFAVSLVSSLL